ncbi:Pyridoxal phosphate-dependent transferase, partial [Trinorchestia longiramus]
MFLNRGPHILRAAGLEQELEEGVDLPFEEIIWTNIGDSQAMGQPPITFARQVLTLCMLPSLLDDPNFPDDTKTRARLLLHSCPGGSLGSSPNCKGLEVVRRHVADAISRRDGQPSDWRHVVLCAGASQGIEVILKLLAGQYEGMTPGVLTPVPQYSLYASLIKQLDLYE